MSSNAVLRKFGASVASRPAAVSTYWAQQHAQWLQKPSETAQQTPEEVAREQVANHAPRYSFKLHLGADLDIVTKDAAWYPQPEQQHPVPDTQQNTDPFAGLPFRGLAEKLGEHFEPVAKAIQEEHKDGRNAARKQFVAEAAGPDDIRVPSVLPITKWAAQSPAMRSTLIADDPSTRKRARLSWYHPEDTMVPRDWFSKGLLEDLRYYNPFNLAGNTAQQPSA